MYPEEYRYTKEHEWIKRDGNEATVGITSYAQKELGDIVYVDLPAAGKQYKANEPFGSIESVKAVSEIYAPVAMEILEVNQKVVDMPEVINTDPHTQGWLIRVKILNEGELGGLMSSGDYKKMVEEKH